MEKDKNGIDKTMIHVHIENAIFQDTQPKEITKLPETGFECFCKKDSLLFFRKLK